MTIYIAFIALLLFVLCMACLLLYLLRARKTLEKPQKPQVVVQEQPSASIIKSSASDPLCDEADLYLSSVNYYNDILKSGKAVRSFSLYFKNDKKACDELMSKRGFKNYVNKSNFA